MSNPFYISATETKNEAGETVLYHKYVDENGERQHEYVNFQPEFFVPGKGHDAVFKPMVGKRPLRRVRTASIDDYRQRTRKMKQFTDIHGDFHPNYQFLSKQYEGMVEYDFTKFRTVWIDIETDYDPKLKPDPPSAQFPVLSIAAYDTLADETYCWFFKEDVPPPDRQTGGGGTVHLVLCEDELDMLQQFMQFWMRDKYPDFAIGWNSDLFDLPYIYYRIAKLFGDEAAELLSPVRSITQTEITDDYGRKQMRVGYDGINCIDMMVYYKKFVLKPRPSYKLETIAQIEVESGKFDYSSVAANLKELYEKSFSTFITYNVQDVHIMDEINTEISLMDLVCTLGYFAKVNPKDCISPVRSWESFTYNYLKKAGMVLPGSKPGEKDEDGNTVKYGYLGGYVKQPETGLHEWIMSFDYASMYPHIIRAFNMGPETIYDSEFHNVDALDIAGEKIFVDPEAFSLSKTESYCTLYSSLHGNVVDDINEANYVITSKKGVSKSKKSSDEEDNGPIHITPAGFSKKYKMYKSGSKEVLRDVINPNPDDVPEHVAENWARTINGFYFNTDKESIFSSMIGVIYGERSEARAFESLSTLVKKIIDEKVIPGGVFGDKTLRVSAIIKKIERDLKDIGKNAAIEQYNAKLAGFLKNLNRESLEDLSRNLATISKTKDVYQMSMKIFINSLYGAMANAHFRLNDVRIAAAITSTGREMIRRVGKEFSDRICARMNKKFGCDIKSIMVYTDTDSIYVSFKELIPHLFPNGVPDNMTVAKKLHSLTPLIFDPVINQIIKEIEDERNMLGGFMRLKREAIAVSGLWMAKKKYALYIVSNEDEWYSTPEMKAIGIDVIKPSLPKYVRDSMKKTMMHILRGEREEFVNQNMAVRRAFRQGFYTDDDGNRVELTYKDLGFSLPVNKLEEWGAEIKAHGDTLPKGCPGQVYAAYVFNKWLLEEGLTDQYKMIEDGDKVYKFQLLPNSGYGTKSRLIDYIVWPMYGDIPFEFGIDPYIDFSHQYDKLYRALVEEMSIIINWPFGYGHYSETGKRVSTRKAKNSKTSSKSRNVKGKIKKYRSM